MAVRKKWIRLITYNNNIKEYEKIIIEDFEYFKNICNHLKKISISNRQEQYLLYFLAYPNYSAYDIHPGKGINLKEYTYAKLTLRKLWELKLIKLNKIKKVNDKHKSKRYSLTDYGIFYIIKSNNLLGKGLIEIFDINVVQNLVKNYSDSKIFHYLLFPYIKLETICSPQIDLSFLLGISNYLINYSQNIEKHIFNIEKNIKSDEKIFFWNYSKLEDLLKNKYHCNWLDHSDFEENFENENDQEMKIKYFDIRNQNNSIEITFNKRLNKGYLYSKYNKIKKHEIPLIQDYIKFQIRSKKEKMVKSFNAWCNPNSGDFILAVLSQYIRSFSDPSTLILLSKDERFKKSLRFTKTRFDHIYKKIESNTKFSF